MNWLERLRGKRRRPDTPLPPDRPAGGTVVRSPARPASTLTKFRPQFESDSEVAGNLQIKRLLGSGGMGKVYLARHSQWDTDVAVKVPNEEIVSDPETMRFIVGEAEAWTKLGLHPHIAYCCYAQQIDELLLLVIEFVDGGNLRTWIADGRCADLKAGLDLAIQFCHGLAHAHKQGMVHRDIKPENILLNQDGTLKITDFGIVHTMRGEGALDQRASVTSAATAGMTTAGIGTAEYMSPEQWGEQAQIDLRADIFAFGVCLYEMLCGRLPYPAMATLGPRMEAPDPNLLRVEDLPEAICELMKRCVDWDRDRRPSSTSEVLTELCNIYKTAFGEPNLHAVLPDISTLADDWNNRALSYLVLGRKEDAEKAWQTALEAEPRHPESTYNYGLYRWREAKITDEALLRSLRESANVAEIAARVALLRARVLLESDDCEGAIEVLEALGSVASDQRGIQEALANAKVRLPTSRRCIRTLEGTGSSVLSSDCRLALSASFQTVKVWDMETGRCLRTFDGHTSHVNSVCLSADGRVALTGGGVGPGIPLVAMERHERDNTLRLWDVATGRCLRVFDGHSSGTNSVCLSADGCIALSGSSDGTLKVWEVATGRCLRTLGGRTTEVDLNPSAVYPHVIQAAGWREPEVKSVCLSANGKFALSGSQDGTAKYWELETGRCLRTFEGHTGEVNSVCLSSEKRFAMSGSSDRTLKLWELATGECLRTFEGHDHEAFSVHLSAAGDWALSGSRDRTLKLWDTTTGRCLRTYIGHKDSVRSVCLSADGKSVLSASSDKTLKLWNVTRSANPSTAPAAFSRLVTSVAAASASAAYRRCLETGREAFLRDKNVLALRAFLEARRQTGFQRDRQALDNYARLYPRLRRAGLAGGWEDETFEPPAPRMKSISMSADGKLALSVSIRTSNYQGDWGPILLWEPVTGRLVRSLETVFEVSCMSADGQFFLSRDGNREFKLWNAADESSIRTFKGHNDVVGSLCLSADGSLALSGGRDNSLKLWDVTTGRCLYNLSGYDGNRYGNRWLCLSQDGRFAVAPQGSGKIGAWEVASGRFLRTFEPAGWVHSIRLSGDGRLMLSGSNDELKLWDFATGQHLRALEGHTGEVLSACFSGDSRFALSGGEDGTVKLWDLESGRCLRTFEGHTRDVSSVCFSPDGRFAFSTSKDNTLKRWFLDWELEENEPADWDEAARPYLQVFLQAQQPYGASLPEDHDPTDEEITMALTRDSRPIWTEEDFQRFLYTLGCAGYGWLRSEGVRCELEQMTAAWTDPQ